MKELIITPEDLLEVEEEIHGSQDILDVTSREVFDFIHKRKITTALLLETKLQMPRRTANEVLMKLFEGKYVDRKIALLKSSDGVKHRTYIYFEKLRENGKQKKRK